ncbi:MAG TPA: O-antigen ligase family protein [Chthonomonadaceae bacterium]|nr:O-antigen ligase family protein [Chthonomonadaceae bacterium]
MIVVVPLVAAPTDGVVIGKYSLGGAAALILETLALLLLIVLIGRVRSELSRERILTFLRTGANVPVLLLLGWSLLSCAFSPHKLFSVQATLQLGAGVLLYFVTSSQFRTSRRLYRLVDALLFLAIAVSLVVLWQFAHDPAAPPTALFGDHQPLGSLLMILLPIAVAIALTEKLSKRQIAAQFASVLTLGSLALTHARSAWIGAAVGIALLVLLAAYTALRRHRAGEQHLYGTWAAHKHKLALPLMLILATAGFLFMVSRENRSIAERAATLTDVAHDGSWKGRQQLHWRGALAMIAARPVTGWGIGLFPVYQNSFTGQGIELSERAVMQQRRASLAEQAHDFYLQTAAELGLPGLLLMVAIPAGFLAAALRRVGKMHRGLRRTLLLGSMAAIMAFAVDALGSPSWQYGQIAMFFWLLLGLGVNCMQPHAGQGQPALESDPAIRPEPSDPIGKLPNGPPTVVLRANAPASGLAFLSRLTRPFGVGTAGLMLAMAILTSAGVSADSGRYNSNSTSATTTTLVFLTLVTTGFLLDGGEPKKQPCDFVIYPNKDTICVGEKAYLTVEEPMPAGGKVKWTMDQQGPAAFSGGDGNPAEATGDAVTVTGIRATADPLKVTATYTAPDGTECTKVAEVTIVEVKISPRLVVLLAGSRDTVNVTATGTPAGGAYLWATGDKDVCQITNKPPWTSRSIKVKGPKVGETTLTVTYTVNKHACTDSIKVLSKEKRGCGIVIEPDPVTVGVNGFTNVTVTYADSFSAGVPGTFNWTVTDPTVVKVPQINKDPTTGQMTALIGGKKAGTATLKCTFTPSYGKEPTCFAEVVVTVK